ncbi:MAG: 50S ribosomal protein L11 methyltransferase [Oceanospirillaceae bacterium]|nr:50S ribosomal protein L11 methyltransferase [Oceanospirillaceae bacterium]
MTHWIQLKAHCVVGQVEATENAMLGLGALSVTLQDDADQPILEPELGTTPVWDQTLVIGLFDAESDANQLKESFPAFYKAEGGHGSPECHVELLEDKDWIRAWMDDYHPMQFGPRLWVCPSWCEPKNPDAVNLMLDPGLAFGTGTHPTTALCLTWLDENIQGNEHLIDFGCGSGILGIAALLLGAEKMTGVDIDPQALIATRDNASRNNINPESFMVYLPDETPTEQADVLVANILAGPLKALAENLSTLVKPGGKLALSGLLATQARELSDHYSQWFVMEAPRQQDDWVILSGTRKL